MDAAAEAGHDELGLGPWFANRRRSWERHNRRLVLVAWLLLGLSVAGNLLPMAIDLQHVLQTGSRLPGSTIAVMRFIGVGLSLALVAAWFNLVLSCIATCRPGPELLGSASLAEFHAAISRGSFAIALRWGLLLLLPHFAVAHIHNLIAIRILSFVHPLLPVLLLADTLVLVLLAALLATYSSLQLGHLALPLQVLAALLGLLGAYVAAGIPTALVYSERVFFQTEMDLWQLYVRLVQLVMHMLAAGIVYLLLRRRPADLLARLGGRD